jgi:hypothetical protein
MLTIGTRKLIGLLACLIVAIVLGIIGLLVKADAGSIAAVEAPPVTLFGIFVTGTWAEWRERRLDASTIAEQIEAERGTAPPKTGKAGENATP